MEIFFHLHPDVRIEAGLICRHKSGAAIRLHPPALTSVAVEIEDTTWRPEFGWQIPNRTVVLRAQTPAPAAFTTCIELL